jgi:hypothetical protein
MDIKTTDEIIDEGIELKVIKNISYRLIPQHDYLIKKWVCIEDIKKEYDPEKIYPRDIFIPLNQKQLDNIQEILNNNGFRLDTLSAHIIRLINKGLIKDLDGGAKQILS